MTTVHAAAVRACQVTARHNNNNNAIQRPLFCIMRLYARCWWAVGLLVRGTVGTCNPTNTAAVETHGTPIGVAADLEVLVVILVSSRPTKKSNEALWLSWDVPPLVQGSPKYAMKEMYHAVVREHPDIEVQFLVTSTDEGMLTDGREPSLADDAQPSFPELDRRHAGASEILVAATLPTSAMEWTAGSNGVHGAPLVKIVAIFSPGFPMSLTSPEGLDALQKNNLTLGLFVPPYSIGAAKQIISTLRLVGDAFAYDPFDERGPTVVLEAVPKLIHLSKVHMDKQPRRVMATVPTTVAAVSLGESPDNVQVPIRTCTLLYTTILADGKSVHSHRRVCCTRMRDHCWRICCFILRLPSVSMVSKERAVAGSGRSPRWPSGVWSAATITAVARFITPPIRDWNINSSWTL